MPTLPPAIRAVATVLIAGQIMAGWVVAWFLQVTSMGVTYFFTTKDQRTDLCGHIFRRVSYITAIVLNPLWRVRILRPLPRLPDKAKYIVASNHLSNADAWCLVSALFPKDCKWVYKGSLRPVPFGGWALQNNGDLHIEFTSEKGGWGTKKGSVSAMMARAKAYLLRGQGIAVFPEGVRNYNPSGPLNEFKLGFFTLAVETGAMVVPVAVSGSETCWPRGTWMFDSADVYITCCDPISSDGLTAEALRDKVMEAISKARDSHPDRVKYLRNKQTAPSLPAKPPLPDKI